MERLNIELQTSRPDPALRGFVRYYSQRYLAPGEYLDEPVTARLGGLLEFHFASLYKIPIIGTDRFESCAPMLVVGPITYRRVQLHADGAVEALTVMFQPFGLHQLFAVPTHLLTEHAVEGHSLLGNAISHLYAKLSEARSFAERVSHLDTYLLGQLSSRERAMETQWHRDLAYVAQNRGRHTISKIAKSLNVSVRQLERKSLDLVGMTPQKMIRVARFVHALRLRQAATEKRSRSWTEIAHASGYYDQMHLIRDFRLMGGARPTALEDQLEPHHGASLLLHPPTGRSDLTQWE
jgi:AraC-like DNA-binding protein